jgi:transposase
MCGYSSDVTDEDWLIIEPIILKTKRRQGRPRKYSMRSMFNAICYVLKTGCQWEQLPKDFPPYKQVHEIYMRWMGRGVFNELLKVTRRKYRFLRGKEEEPTCAIVDSKTVQTVLNHRTVGVDGHKKNQGHKKAHSS